MKKFSILALSTFFIVSTACLMQASAPVPEAPPIQVRTMKARMFPIDARVSEAMAAYTLASTTKEGKGKEEIEIIGKYETARTQAKAQVEKETASGIAQFKAAKEAAKKAVEAAAKAPKVEAPAQASASSAASAPVVTPAASQYVAINSGTVNRCPDALFFNKQPITDPVDALEHQLNNLSDGQGFISHGDATNPDLQNAGLVVGLVVKHMQGLPADKQAEAASKIVRAGSKGRRIHMEGNHRRAFRMPLLGKEAAMVQAVMTQHAQRAAVHTKLIAESEAAMQLAYDQDVAQALAAQHDAEETYGLVGPSNVHPRITDLVRAKKLMGKEGTLTATEAYELVKYQKDGLLEEESLSGCNAADLSKALANRAEEVVSEDEADHVVFPQFNAIFKTEVHATDLATATSTRKGSRHALSVKGQNALSDLRDSKK